jgi:hypothetical protein
MPHVLDMIKAQVKSGHIVPIQPRNRVYLTVFGGGDGPRFARLFRETWVRLPLSVRRKLLAHWRKGGTLGFIVSPDVELSDYPFGPGRTFGMVDHYGHRLRFRAKFVDPMPDNVVQDLIAHELAHVLQSAQGIRCVRKWTDGRAKYVDSDGMDFGGNFEIELSADEAMSRWGFNPESLDDWAREAGITKVVKGDLRTVLRRFDRLGRLPLFDFAASSRY